jgi:hypothetical protein
MNIIRRSLVTSRRAGGVTSISSGTSSGRGVVPGGIGGHYLHHDFASTNSSRTGTASRSSASRTASEETANSSVNNSRERLSELSTRIDDLIQYQREVETEMNANISSYAQRDRLRNLIGSRTSSARIHLVDLASSPPSRPVLTRPPLHPSSTTTNSTAPLTSSSTTTTTTTTTTETNQLPHDDIDRFERLENYRRLRRFAYNTRSSRSSSSSSIPTQSSSRPTTSDLLNDNHNSSSTSGLSGRYNPSQSSESSRTRAERSRFDKTKF